MNYNKLKKDLAAASVVFLIALPLCLGIALASGAPLISGLVAGVVGGLVVSLLSGSSVSVSGPAAGLTVVVLDAISRIGSFEKFLVAVMISGIFQLIFSLFRLGFIADFIPTCVIQGMLVAIGIVIILKQIPHALGRDLDYEGDFSFFGRYTYGNSVDEIIQSVLSANAGALSISLLSLLIVVYWPTLKMISPKIRLIPGSLIAVIIAVLLNNLFSNYLPMYYLAEGSGHRVAVPVNLLDLERINEIFPRPNFSAFFNLQVWITGFIISVVGSVETLLSIEASDKLDKQRRISNPNRELLAQGVGNLMSGFLGGIPVTSVVVRSSANIASGAETRFASFFHGLFLLCSVLFFSSLMNEIPLSALAAVLLAVGYKLASPKLFKEYWQLGVIQFAPFICTVLAVVFTDLLTGVAIGCIFGLYFVLIASYRDAFTEVHQDNHYLIRFNNNVSFLHKSELKRKLNMVPDNITLIIDGTKANIIDYDIKDLIRDFIQSAKFKGIEVEIKNITKV